MYCLTVYCHYTSAILFIFEFTMGERSLLFECMKNENIRLKSQVADLQQALCRLRAKLEIRNKEILSLMKEEIIDLTNDEEFATIPLRRKSVDEFLSWAFDEQQYEEVKEEDVEEVIYKTPSPRKKLKF